MGLKKDSGSHGNFTFVNFKDGKMIAKIEGEKQTFQELENVILKDLEISDEEYPKGTFYKKLDLYFHDPKEDHVYKLGMPMTSGYGWAFFCISPNIDFKKEMDISGGSDPIEGTEKKWGKIYIKQDGKNLKWYFKKGEKASEKIPPVKETKVGTGKYAKTVKDYSKRDEFIERSLVEILKRIQKTWPEGIPKKIKEEKINKNQDSDTESMDDLPF